MGIKRPYFPFELTLRFAIKVFARTMSRVVTPKILLGLYFPAFLKISDAMGTVELTGFEIIAKHASGQTSAAAVAK